LVIANLRESKMKPDTAGKVLIAIGCLLMVYALNMSISIGSFGGYEIANIHLLNQRQILLFLGGFLFVGGIVLYSSNKAKQTKEQEEQEEAAIEKEVEEQFKKFNDRAARFASRIKQITDNYAIKIKAISHQYKAAEKILRIATALLVGVFAGVFLHILISLVAWKLFEAEILSDFGYTFGVVLVLFTLNGLRDIPDSKYYRQLKIIFAISTITIIALLIVGEVSDQNHPRDKTPKPTLEQKPDVKPIPDSLPERLGVLNKPTLIT